MNCQEAQNLIPSYLAADEPWLGLEDRVVLERHLAECATCWEAYEESHQAVEFLRSHWQVSGDTQTLQAKAILKGSGQNAAKVFWFFRISKKVAAVAAAIVIGLVVGLGWWSNQDPHEQEWGIQVKDQEQQVLKVTENGLVVESVP